MMFGLMYASTCARGSRAACCAALAAVLIAAWASPSFADLRVHPKRVIFDGKTRTATVTLVNNDPETYTYRITWQMLRMTDQGKLERFDTEVEGEGGVSHAHTMLRYAPRQVTVAPGVAQTVRIMLRKPKELPDGEYRAHMLFLREPKQMSMGDDEDGLAITLNVLYGLSIPIFVRQGELDVDVAIDDIETAREGDVVNMSIQLSRTGNRSVYGDLDVLLKSAGEDLVLGTVRGVGIYTEAGRRTVPVALQMPDGTPVPPGNKVLVRYRAPKEQNNALLAEATVTIN